MTAGHTNGSLSVWRCNATSLDNVWSDLQEKET